MNPSRCTNVVTWWGYDLRSSCRRALHHRGVHHDGLWAWDDQGVRVDGTVHEYRPGSWRAVAVAS